MQMHELGLARSLLREVKAVWAQHPGRTVSQVDVQSGPLSGVEPLLLADAFARLTQEQFGQSIELVVHQVPLTAMCNQCRREVTIERFRFVCPECGGTRLTETQGDCLKLLSIDLAAVV